MATPFHGLYEMAFVVFLASRSDSTQPIYTTLLLGVVGKIERKITYHYAGDDYHYRFKKGLNEEA